MNVTVFITGIKTYVVQYLRHWLFWNINGPDRLRNEVVARPICGIIGLIDTEVY